jgi:hypothetical protein
VTDESSWVTILDRSVHSHEGPWIGTGSSSSGGHSKCVGFMIHRGFVQAIETNYDSGIANTRDSKCSSIVLNLTLVNENTTSSTSAYDSGIRSADGQIGSGIGNEYGEPRNLAGWNPKS